MELPAPKNKMTDSKNVHSLKGPIFHTMEFKLSLEINKNQINLPTKRSFLNVLKKGCQIAKHNQIQFQHYNFIHAEGPKIAICETTSNAFFTLDTSLTTKDQYFQAAILEVIKVLNAVLLDFGYHQKLEC